MKNTIYEYGVRFIYPDGRERDTDIVFVLHHDSVLHHEGILNDIMDELNSTIRIELFVKGF